MTTRPGSPHRPVCQRRRCPKRPCRGWFWASSAWGSGKPDGDPAGRTVAHKNLQWYLPSLGVGAIVQPSTSETAVCSAPVVQGDETGSVRTPRNDTSCVGVGIRGWWMRCGFLLQRSVGSDFYAAYNHYPGLKQRCWAHLLRDIHDLKGLYPEDAGLAPEAVHQVYTEAKASVLPRAQPGFRSHPANCWRRN